MAKAITIALVISYLLDRQVKRRIERAKARKPELENQRIEQELNKQLFNQTEGADPLSLVHLHHNIYYG